VFKRVLPIEIEFLRGILILKILIEKHLKTQTCFENFEIGVVVRSFCFGLILSPPLAWIAKNGYFVSEIGALFKFSPPLANNIWVKDYTKVESDAKWRRRVNNTIEWSGSLAFAEDSISLSIYDLAWNILEKHISRSTWKRYDQRYINELCVQSINQNSENQECLAHS
jgi:hypothetical protein